MDRFDRIFAWMLSVFVVAAATILVVRFHTWKDLITIGCVCVALVAYIWLDIAKQSRRLRLCSSICGDNSGPADYFCTLEPNHPGDHKHFHSSGGCIGWPRKSGKP